jgi:exopolysaccharide biosynthesis polyprenyl glycosylphosphotransferase
MPVVTAALLVGDLFAVLTSYVAATMIVDRSMGLVAADSNVVHTQGVWILVLWPLAMWALGLYDRKIDLSVVDQWPRIVGGASLATMARLAIVLLSAGLAGTQTFLNYEVATLAWVLSVVTIPLVRLAIRFAQRQARLDGVTEKRTLIIGAGHVATLMADKMGRSPELGLKPVGFLDPDPPEIPSRDAMDLPVYGDVRDLESILAEQNINHVLVAFSADGFCKMFEIIDRCSNAGVEISIVPRFFEISAAAPKMDEIEGVPVMTLTRPQFSPGLRIAKRTMDLVLGAIVVVVTLPIQALVAVSILTDSGGPVLHTQERIGKDGLRFTMYKFRSMTNGAAKRKAELLDQNEQTGPIFKMHDDPRVTRVGKVLRRYSLDELPQIYNVLRGDMSLVGPRPPLPCEVAEYSDWDTRRLAVTPGITGLWQVLGRSELTFDEMVSLDLNYIWNWSPWLDVSIMARTVGAVVHGKGAY